MNGLVARLAVLGHRLLIDAGDHPDTHAYLDDTIKECQRLAERAAQVRGHEMPSPVDTTRISATGLWLGLAVHTPRHGLGRQADDAGSFGKNFGKIFGTDAEDVN